MKILEGGVGAALATQRGGGDQPAGLLRDIGRLYVRPGALFADLPRWNRSAAALVLLMGVYALYAVAVLSTGVSDYEVEAAAQKEMSRFADQPRNDENAEELNQALDALEKGATFSKMLGRVLMVLGGPVSLAADAGLLAGILFVVVALCGVSKPDFHLLAGVAVFAAYVEIPRLLVRLLLISQLQVSRVETSAAAFAASHVSLAVYLLLRRLDPFDVWYWGLVGLGVWKTGQLRGRAAVLTVVGLALLAALAQSALEVPELAVFPAQPAEPP